MKQLPVRTAEAVQKLLQKVKISFSRDVCSTKANQRMLINNVPLFLFIE